MTDFVPGPDTARLFRDALGRFSTGVTLVTTQDDDGPLGIIANSFASVSLSPPLVLWSPARASQRFDSFTKAEHFAIHVLSHGQARICTSFTREGRNFDELTWELNGSGVPIVADTLARFECEQHAVHDGGDHAIVVGRVTAARLGSGAPLLFSSGQYGRFAQGR